MTRSAKEVTDLSSIAQWVAEDNGYNLSFEVPDKKIARYSFTGSASAQMLQLEALAQCNVYVENQTLYLTDTDAPAKGGAILKLDKYSGLIKQTAQIKARKFNFYLIPWQKLAVKSI